MATLTLRIDDRIRDEIEAHARARGITVSDLLRGAIDQLLGRDDGLPRGDVPRTLTHIERRTLSLQHEILAHLTASDEYEHKYHQDRKKALDAGYTAEYEDEFIGVEPELSRRECTLVWDILDMFHILEASMRSLGTEAVNAIDEHAAQALAFRGFDLNDSLEGRLLGYARFLIADEKWQDLAEHFGPGNDKGNSHARMLPTYQRMLEAFQPIWQSKINNRGFASEQMLLTAEELGLVMKAWPYPRATE